MKLTYRNAIYQALYDELDANHDVILLGEDIRDNVYGYTEGLVDVFGKERIINIPLSEASVTGIVCGAAMCGLRPILDLTIPNFLYIAMDQIANVAAKTRYMNSGTSSLPLTIFCSSMCGNGNAAQHSDRLHSLFMNIPGLKVLCPANVQDMYLMFKEGIEDDNPVLCFADRSLFWLEDDVSVVSQKKIGEARVVREGNDLTIVTISGCLHMVEEIYPQLLEKKISAEIIDVRTVVPLDFSTIKKSVEKTGRVIICDTANRTGSAASEIASLLIQYAFESLKNPVQIVACEDIPVPFTRILEQQIIVTKEKIYNTILNKFKW